MTQADPLDREPGGAPEPAPQPDVSQPGFWEAAYQAERTGWDLGQPAPPFVHLLDGPHAPPPGRMLVVGAGRGHDALLFARAGFDVTGIDFAPSAIAAAAARAQTEQVPATFIEADVFTVGARWPAHFDYVLEHTCFCAIDPQRRQEYVAAIGAALRPGGELIALFYVHQRGGGPPFATTEAEVRALFEPAFTIESLTVTPHSVTQRQGEELLGRLRRR